MNGAPQSDSRLLQLDERPLDIVLCCCIDDPRSLFSAARAHSMLHQAAARVASTIRVVVRQQQQVDSVLQYITNHEQHVSSLDLQGDNQGTQSIVSLHQLAIHRGIQRLTSLSISSCHVGWPGWLQLLPYSPAHGAPIEVHLKQLRLHNCALLDPLGLGAALSVLPGLQHLSFVWNREQTQPAPGVGNGILCPFPSSVLQQLQQLTYLELGEILLLEDDEMRHLQGLTRLQDLRLDFASGFSIGETMLSDLQHLTRLKIHGTSHGPENDNSHCYETVSTGSRQVPWQARPRCSTLSWSDSAYKAVQQALHSCCPTWSPWSS